MGKDKNGPSTSSSTSISTSSSSASDRQTLAILETVQHSSEATQRDIASTTGMSLGLVNAIIRDLANRGWIKIRQVPRRRLLYYLTPRGFAEKSALLVRVLETVQDDYQQIRQRLHSQALELQHQGHRELTLVGDPFLLEIGCLCCLELGLEVHGLHSDKRVGENIGGHRIQSSLVVPDSTRSPCVWQLEYSLLGLERNLVVERSRKTAELTLL
ncbi:MAG: winged helix-turn-helix transcriptional regulator [Verrucomicrobiae bacterium]|nr:winged helix-turn-helix transcriptional regulator [Verrucomicrobiae bacterium]